MSEDLNELLKDENDIEDIYDQEQSQIEEDNSTVLELNHETFSKLYSIMNLVSKVCTDLTIKDGVIRQYSDRRHAIISIDTTELVGNVTLYLSGVASKVDLLDPFRKQGVSIQIEMINQNSTNGFYIFKDDYSKIEFQKPFGKYLNNQCMTQDEFHTRLSIDEEGPIFEYQISKFLLDRLTALQKGLGASIIKLEFKDNKANLIVTAGDKTSTITTVGRLITINELEREVEGTCVFPIQPFLLGGDTVTIKSFFRDGGDNVLLQLSSKVEDVPIDIWCIAHLINDEE